jgi:homoserine kinase
MSAFIKVTVPATVANVGCGFDVLGFALEAPADVVYVGFNASNEIQVFNHTEFDLPLHPEQNCAGKAVLSYLQVLGKKRVGIDIHIAQKIRPGGGLGSSAASAVAAALGVNTLFNNPLENKALMKHCLEGEAVASKAWHADNVAPALLGGFTLINGYDPLEIIQLPVPDDLYCTVAHPNIKVETAQARALLPSQVLLENATQQCGNMGGLIAGLYTSNIDLIGRSVQDVLVAPQRAALIPGYHRVKNAVVKAGAMCCEISGSGPTMFAFSKTKKQAERVGVVMQRTFNDEGLFVEVYASKIKSSQPLIEQLEESPFNNKEHELL